MATGHAPLVAGCRVVGTKPNILPAYIGEGHTSRPMRGIAALIATAFLLLAGPSPVLLSAEAQLGTSSLSGSVCQGALTPDLAACSGHLLGNATVRLTKPGPLGNDVAAADASAVTDAKGHYSITELADGQYTATVTRAGFEPLTATVDVKGATTQDFALQGAEVAGTGHVVDPNGSGVGDATVSFHGARQASVLSGPDGSFRFTTVGGFQTVTVEAPGFAAMKAEQFIDGTKALRLVVGKPPAQDAVIQGTVRDQEGNAVAGIEIQVYDNSYPCCIAYDCAYDTPAPSGSGSSGATEPAVMPCGRPYDAPYHGGQNVTKTDASGRYKVNVYGGSSVSMSISREGYASWYDAPYVDSGQTLTLDVKLMKFPEKTARLVGQVTEAGSGDGLRLVSISMSWPEFGVYECSDNGVGYPYDGGVTYTSSGTATATAAPVPPQSDADTNTVSGNPENGGTATQASSGKAAPSTMIYPYPGENGCRIKVDADGRFDAMVTPGYATVNVYYEQYKSCTTTTNADHSSATSCGPDYYGWSGVLTLAQEGETRLDVQLAPKPRPDATVSGYIVDGGTKKAIAAGQVSFYNMDNSAGGYAQTDADGSYRVALRSGWHQVSVYMDGYFPWQATVLVEEGDNAYDIVLTRGQASYGGCYQYCIMESGSKDAAGGPSPMAPGMASSGTTTSGPGRLAGDDDGGDGAVFQDLHGGLGPYDPDKRNAQLGAEKASPHLELVALVGVLGALAFALRRRLSA